ncbi:phage head-binding domain-containing protein [Citrobacter sp. NCU1]|uniref:phage head-binding domain-containing protein n=1 Tax=Citrobacter sp. NCU1 TaxID=2026683 RepID=UPI001EE2C3D2|nr:phage head-binding domain-containing protein [Citrobacter sp. NCU1]
MSDITANVVVSMPSQLFTMPRQFKAVANGKIYIGLPDTDPTSPSNQIQVYLENEDGSHVPIDQPLVINSGGYPVYNGQIAKFVTVQNHSMAVYDLYNSQQFYFPDILKYSPDQLRQELGSDSGASLIGVDGGGTLQDKLDKYDTLFHRVETVSELHLLNEPIGTKVRVLGYYEAGDIPEFDCIIQEGNTDEDFGYVFKTNNGYALRTTKFDTLDIRYYGAKQGDATATTRAINNIMMFTQKSDYRTIYIPSGEWPVNSVAHEIKVDNFSIYGEDGAIVNITIGFLIGAYPYATGGFRRNISVDNIRFVGNNTSAIACFDMSMVVGITIKNCIFEECVVNGHVLDAIGCSEIMVANCQVVGSNLGSQVNKYAEAFQLAEADPAGQSWRHPEYDTFFDGRSSTNAVFSNCRFVPKLNLDGSIKSYPPRPIGGHSPGASAAIKNLTISNCFIDRVTPYTPGVPRTEAISAINVFVSGIINISDNVYIGHGSSTIRSRPFLCVAYKPEYVESSGTTINVDRNTIPRSGEAVTDSEILISTLTGSASVTRNVIINLSGNQLSSVIGTQPQLLVQVNNSTNPITGVRLNVRMCSIKLSRYIAFATEVQEVHVSDCISIDGSTQAVNAQCSIVQGLFAVVTGCTMTRSGFTDTRGYLRSSLSHNTWNSENSQGGVFRRCIISTSSSFSSVGNRVYGQEGGASEYGIFFDNGVKQSTADYEFSVKS